MIIDQGKTKISLFIVCERHRIFFSLLVQNLDQSQYRNSSNLTFIWIPMYYGNTGCQVFMREVRNCKDFCLKINIPKGDYWILKIGVWGTVKKYLDLIFKANFLCQKNHWNLFNFFFSLKVINLGAHFLLLTFLNHFTYWNDAQFLTPSH